MGCAPETFIKKKLLCSYFCKILLKFWAESYGYQRSSEDFLVELLLVLRLYKDIFVKGKYNQFWRQASLWMSMTVWKPLKCAVKNSRNRKSFLRCKRNLFYLNITVADFVLLVLVGSSSLPKLLTGTYKCWSTFKTIGRHLELSADSYKSSSVSFELHNCRPIVTTVSQHL